MAGGSSSSGSAQGSLTSDINVTPMVDIMLVVLIIFIVITPMLQAGVAVTLPKGKSAVEDSNINNENAVVIAIPSDGMYYMGKELVRKEQLTNMIKERMDKLRPGDPHVVYIKGGTNVSYGEIVSIVHTIRDANYEQLGLVADEKVDGQE